MNFYKGKKVLVAGGTGLIGSPLVELLIDQRARVRIASLDDISRFNPNAEEFYRLDLREFANCKKACEGMDYVFNLLCVKGSPKATEKNPADFFDNTLLFNTNLLRAAREAKAEKYLFTSSYGVYAPENVFFEDAVWKTFPSERDKFAAWSKRMGELQAEAYQIQYGWNDISIVRPANTYGPNDNFSKQHSMVIPSLIRRIIEGENPLVIFGDGNDVRDFVHARDVAKGMLTILEKSPGPKHPVNLGSGKGYTIRDLVKIIIENTSENPKVIWDTSNPQGDRARVVDISRARSLGFSPGISLEQGIKETIEWYKSNKEDSSKRYDVISDN